VSVYPALGNVSFHHSSLFVSSPHLPFAPPSSPSTAHQPRSRCLDDRVIFTRPISLPQNSRWWRISGLGSAAYRTFLPGTPPLSPVTSHPWAKTFISPLRTGQAGIYCFVKVGCPSPANPVVTAIGTIEHENGATHPSSKNSRQPPLPPLSLSPCPFLTFFFYLGTPDPRFRALS